MRNTPQSKPNSERSQDPTPIVLADGLHTDLFEFRSRADAPVLLIVPALGAAARAYQRFGKALADGGFNALVLDLRGVGSSSVRAARGSDWGYLDLVDAELRQLWVEADRRFPQARKILLGHSMGGHLSLLHQSRHADQPVDEIALVASGSPWHTRYAWFGSPVLRLFAALVEGSSQRLGVFRGDWLGFGGRQGARLMREWARFCRAGLLDALGEHGWNAMPALQRCQRRLYAISMRSDHYAPPASTEHLASLTAGDLHMDRLSALDSGHPPGHFAWLKQPGPVVALLRARYAHHAPAEVGP